MHAIALCKIHNLLASGDEKGNVRVWSLRTMRCVLEVSNLHGEATVLTLRWIYRDLNLQDSAASLLTHGRDGNVRKLIFKRDIDQICLDLESNILLLRCNELSFANVAVGADNEDIYHVPENEPNLVSGSNGKKYVDTSLGTGSVMRICFEPVQNSLIVGYESGHVVIFDAMNCRTMYSTKFDNNPVLGMDAKIVNDKLVVICGSVDSQLALWKVFENKIKRITCQAKGNCSISIRSDGKLFAAGNWSGYVRVHAPKLSMPFLAKLNGETSLGEKLHCVVCMEDENLIAAGGENGNIVIWKIY